MNIDCNLYVVTHKKSDFLPKGRKFIGVGNKEIENKEIENVTVYDNTKDNIAEKNKNYCELTALYWIWKNDKSDYVGLEHYRRFFCSKWSIIKPVILSERKITKLLTKYDGIVSKKFKPKLSIYSYYEKKHCIGDLIECKNIIRDLFPEYSVDFDKIIYGRECSMCNMFIMKKTYVDEYCAWLFPILFELEKRIDISDRDQYQQRVFGFLSERLFNVWLEHKKLNLVYKPIYMPNDFVLYKKIKSYLAYLLK